MKKIGILLCTMLIGFSSLTACSSDNAVPVIEQEKDYLIGKWNGISRHSKIEMDGEIVMDNLNDEEGSMYGIIQEYEFKADNTVDYYTYIPANGSNEASED